MAAELDSLKALYRNQRAAAAGASFPEAIGDVITAVELGARPFRALGDSGDSYEASAMVIATGAQARWLNLPSETSFFAFPVKGSSSPS